MLKRLTTPCLLALAACLLPAAQAGAQDARTSIVNGTPVPITSVPWQVLVISESQRTACGGSVLDARRVLTAAHCLATGTTARPPSDFTVLAGSDTMRWAPGSPVPSGAQAVGAQSVRIHPYFVPGDSFVAADVAVITLARALNLSTPRTKPIALAPPGALPAPGTPLLATGYGTQVRDQPPNGGLYAGGLSAISDLGCLTSMTPNQSSSVLCANGPTGAATCFGDSGGPLVGNGALVGVTSATSGLNACTSPWPGLYADVTAPEIRAFIDGSATPPMAPRISDGAQLRTLAEPVVGSPIGCLSGTWSGATQLTYTFFVEGSGLALQAGPSNAYAPGSAQVGTAVGCLVQAINAGGVSSARTGATRPIAHDRVRPKAALRSVRCRKRRCRVRLAAADSNSLGPLRVRVTAERRVRGWCRKGKGPKRHRVRCTKRHVKRFAVAHTGGVRWTARAKRVRRGRPTLRVRVVDAAGNRARGRHLKRRIRVR